MKITLYGQKMVRLEMTEDQLAIILACTGFVSEQTKDIYVKPFYRYLHLLFKRATKARDEFLC